MRPRRIILIRHGESEGNLDRNTYAVKQDFKLLLTPQGLEQATDAGEQLKKLVGEGRVVFYVSPLWRTRMTFEHIAKALEPSQFRWKEDPRLREQEWGHFRDLKANILIDDERNKFGTFYYRIKDGESCADVYDRMSDFLHSLFRDFEKPGMEENLVIITHGMTLRIFLMRWFKWTVEEFETLRNPKNCEMVVMELDNSMSRYKIVTPLGRRRLQKDDMYQWEIVTQQEETGLRDMPDLDTGYTNEFI